MPIYEAWILDFADPYGSMGVQVNGNFKQFILLFQKDSYNEILQNDVE